MVMSVLILEDMLAIVMMVMLSALASGANLDGGQMVGSVVRIGFFLVLWFVVGIFAIPWLLRSSRTLINNETLLIIALGLCCAMAVVSTKVGFSSAFGAFVMGSILAETVEAEKIIKLVEPVKNLFGAVFFVSVGMLVDPKILVDYSVPIMVLVLTILVGQAVFGSFGFLISGQSLKSAMQCGFSMAQIGEFSFIIASLGLSLGVIGNFLYPVVVAVSVITTFLTPYMIRLSTPAYNRLEKRLPKNIIHMLNELAISHPSAAPHGNWRSLVVQLTKIVVIYSILSIAVIALMFTVALVPLRQMLPHWWANAVCGLATVLFISPFLRAMVMKKNHSEEFKQLWNESRMNHAALIATIVVRFIIAMMFVFYICNYLTRFTNAVMIVIAVVVVMLMILSRRLKRRSIRMERMFLLNLRSRDIKAQVYGHKRPLYAGHLLDRDIHISDFDVPEDSLWAGKTLEELQLRSKFGVNVSSILRGRQRINIPSGDDRIYPCDKIQVIGSDEQLTALSKALKNNLHPEDPNIEKREMKLRQLVISEDGQFFGKTLSECGIRDIYDCMVVGMEEGEENLSMLAPNQRFYKDDTIWVVGEKENLERLMEANRTRK